MKEITSGVCAFIISPSKPNSFLGVVEGNTSYGTHKVAGMISAPFETLEPGETHRSALIRAVLGPNGNDGEELSVTRGEILIPEGILEQKICKVALRPGVMLHAYVLYGSRGLQVDRGICSDVVGVPRWVSFDEVLRDRHFVFRPGNAEVVRAFLGMQQQGSHQPYIYEYPVNSVPDGVFKLIEQDINPAAALSQFVVPMHS